jgi:hypothetical protein
LHDAENKRSKQNLNNSLIVLGDIINYIYEKRLGNLYIKLLTPCYSQILKTQNPFSK